MANLDYQSGPQTIVISDGTVDGDTACIDISLILDDALLEPTEIFSITLSSVSPCGNVDSGVTVLEIIDDEGKLLVSRPLAHVCDFF